MAEIPHCKKKLVKSFDFYRKRDCKKNRPCHVCSSSSESGMCPRIPFIKNSLVLYTFELAGNLKKITDDGITTQKRG